LKQKQQHSSKRVFYDGVLDHDDDENDDEESQNNPNIIKGQVKNHDLRAFCVYILK
jgi:hypothetical protein